MLKPSKKVLIFTSSIIGILVSFVFIVYIDAYDMKIFRSMQDKIDSTEDVDLTGLREMRASGGYLPRFPTLAKRLSHVKENIIVINAESNLTEYVEGLPITLVGYKLDVPALKHYIRRLVFTGTTKAHPQFVSSGAEEAKKYGFSYKNLVITSRSRTPDKNVDAFVEFFDNYAQNSWFHFHCAHGKGRTSMLLVMYDTMKNAPQVALKDIIKRQHLLGSVNLGDTNLWIKGAYTKKMLENRKKFIEEFYEFVCQRKKGGIQQWSEWTRRSP